jgi:hypothetical protein
MLFASVLTLLFAGAARASEPIVPDTSEECLSCQSQMSQMMDKWTNETTVAAILEDLQKNCKTEYNFMEAKICDALVEIFVQIPPGLFEGIETLAWPMPLAPCALVSKCHVDCCAAGAPPEQVHLSLASSDSSLMGVAWTTLEASASVVQYGLTADNLDMTATGAIGTYTFAGWIGTLHTATMNQLKSGTTYYYRVGDGDSSWSNVFHFQTMAPGQTFTAAVIADMGYGEASDFVISDLLSLVDSGEIQAVIHSGDISYADGYEPHWDNFFNKIEPIASRIPYMATPGNHEFWANFTAYKHRFFLPGVMDAGGSGDNMYYSWTMGHAHFAAMNSESPIDTAQFKDEEMEWLNQDLASVDREQTEWIIAHFHRPMYCSSDHGCEDGALKLKEKAEPIFHEHKVDLVLQGHVHSYERSWPVYQDQVTSKDYNSPTAPVYILQGASGNREGNKGGYPPVEEMPDYSAVTHTEVGFALLTVAPSTLDWVFYEATTADTERKELDRITITRN